MITSPKHLIRRAAALAAMLALLLVPAAGAKQNNPPPEKVPTPSATPNGGCTANGKHYNVGDKIPARMYDAKSGTWKDVTLKCTSDDWVIS